MRKRNGLFCITLAVAGLIALDAGQAGEICATEQEKERVLAFYEESGGALPFTAARRLGLPEAKVVAALPAGQAVSAPGSAFAEVWAVLSRVSQANFLITKGGTVFEILSGVSPGAPSTRSQYFNIEYTEPLRGHLRPDEYAAIYALDLEIGEGDGEGQGRLQGVLFYDGEGELVFGVFVSGEALTTTDEDRAHFASVKALIADKPGVCGAGAAGVAGNPAAAVPRENAGVPGNDGMQRPGGQTFRP